MRVLVTGGTGFVGSNVVRALRDAGHEVRALIRTASRKPADLSDVSWVSGDVLDRPSLEAAAAGCEAVVHAAAVIGYLPKERNRQEHVNLEGTRNILAAAKSAGVK